MTGDSAAAALQSSLSAGVSSRPLRCLIPFNSYGQYYIEAIQRPWTQENQDGYINLCMAENSLHAAEVRDKLEMEGRDPPPYVSGYVLGEGVEKLREEVAKFLERKFLRGVGVRKEELYVTNGTTTLLENLAYCLADEGEGILAPAPFYCAFTRDLQARGACVLLPVPEPDGSLLPSVASLKAAKKDAEERSIPVRVLLLTNPHNPTGFVLPEERLAELLLWAIKEGLHVISDEIYAKSLFSPPSSVPLAPFVSAVRVAQTLVSEGKLGEREVAESLHLLYGMSKDFCMNGYRVGFLWTRSPSLMTAMKSVGDFSMVPVHLQHALAGLLADEQWVDAYLERNSRSLLSAYLTLTNGLEKHGIPFLPVGAGMFVWVDLRKLLSSSSSSSDALPGKEEEMELFHRLREECKVLVAPGSDSGHPIAGFFRFCFAACSPEALSEAVDRIGQLWASAKAL